VGIAGLRSADSHAGERRATASELQDRASLDAALDCVICMDDHGPVTYFNESAQRTFGYPSD
jgi:PAS domain-containing protein